MACIVVMGVAGCGKSTFGQVLAQALTLTWIDGDDFHSSEAKTKMAAGIPLGDADREGWLQTLSQRMAQHPQACVMGCSALKRSYRNVLRQAGPVKFAYLQLSREEAQRRVSSRAGHFFSETLVASQFATLEDPAYESDVIVLDAMQSTQQLLAQALAVLRPSVSQV
jgi:gluconokinase